MGADLRVRCKVCGEGFRIPVKLDETDGRATSREVPSKAYQCSKCGQKRFYEVTDHYAG